MISSVVLAGTLKEKINGRFRYIETTKDDSLHPSQEAVCHIPIQYWTRNENNALMTKEEGIEVAIKGRIESDEEIGLYILVETIHFYTFCTKEQESR